MSTQCTDQSILQFIVSSDIELKIMQHLTVLLSSPWGAA